MAKKTMPGNVSLKNRGLVGLVVHLLPGERTALRRAAAMCDPPETMTRFAARILTAEARKVLRSKGIKS